MINHRRTIIPLHTMNMKSKIEEEEFSSLSQLFGSNVKARRETLRQAHDEVAKAVKISAARLVRIEAGTETRIPLTLIMKFAEYFKIDFKEMRSEFFFAAKKETSKKDK